MIRIFSHYVHGSAVRSMLFDLCIAVGVTLLAILLYAGSLGKAVPLAGGQLVSFAAALLAISNIAGLYEPAPSGLSSSRALSRALLVLALALPVAYLLFGMLPPGAFDTFVVQMAAMAGVSALVLRRSFMNSRSSRVGSRTRILIYGAGPAAQVVGATLLKADRNALIVGYVPGSNESAIAVAPDQLLALQGTLSETAAKLGVDEIVVALTERRAGSMPLRELLDCRVAGVKVYDLNSHFEKTLGQIRVDYLNASWLIFGDGFNQGTARTLIKRAFDLLCSSVLLVLSLPVMLVTAVLIKLESAGPVLYRQERVGLNGRTFEVIKFRSMRTDAERDGKPRWASANDDRVTRVGAFIRRARIDELPQLVNVLKGEMSLVGPRPERAYFVEQLTQQIPFFALRHSVKPGVTGWAQVRYAYGATVEDSQEKLQYDLYYAKNHTLFLDLIVLLETVGVVLTGKGAR